MVIITSILALLGIILFHFNFKRRLKKNKSEVNLELFNKVVLLKNEFKKNKEIKEILIREGYNEKEIKKAFEYFFLLGISGNFFSTNKGVVILVVLSLFTISIEIMTRMKIINIDSSSIDFILLMIFSVVVIYSMLKNQK